MRSRLSCALLSLIAFATSTCSASEPTIGASEATHHIDGMATVCGRLAEISKLHRAKGRPTLLNFGDAYPHQEFTALIWERDIAVLAGLDLLPGMDLCVRGTVDSYRGRPQIIVRSTDQIARPADAANSYTPLRADDVAAIQALLRALGFAPGPTDGILGPRTKSAIREFQQAETLTQTGTPNPVTRRRLLERWRKHHGD